MFRLTAMLLAAALCCPATETARPDIRAVALEIPTGAPVRVKTVGRQTLQGKLTAVTPDGVTLQVLEKDQITERSVAFSEIKSIKQTGKPMSAGKGVVIGFAVLYGIAFLVYGIAAAVN